MLEEFSFFLKKLCSSCYKENRYTDFKEGTCLSCHSRSPKPVYVNAKKPSEFVRNFKNKLEFDHRTNVDDCPHIGIDNKFIHATEKNGCNFVMNRFEEFVWNWMKTNRKFKISELYNEFVAPFVFTPKPHIQGHNAEAIVASREYCNMINPVPYSSEQNERFEEDEKKKVYFCSFCLKNVISEHDIAIHVGGSKHKLYYEADKKRRWYFKMPRSNPVVICQAPNCSCLAPHEDDEYQEMNARIKFKNFNFKSFDLMEKTLYPWPLSINLKMPLFPRNIECYKKSIRANVLLILSDWCLSYICLRDDESRPFFCLHNNNNSQKGQLLKYESSEKHHLEKLDFEIEFSPMCSGTYTQRLEFGFLFHGKEYCCQKLIRVDIGSRSHLDQFKIIYEKYNSILKRDLMYHFDNMVPFSLEDVTCDTILTEELLRSVFRVVSNLQWFDTPVGSWNYCDWMRDMMVHEELEQQLLLSQLEFVGNIQIENTFTKSRLIPATHGKLFGTILFKNECHDSFARDFLVNNIVKAFVCFPDRLTLYECDIVDKYKYGVESRSIKEATFCFSERTVKELQLKSGTVYHNVVIYFRYNRLVFNRRHKSLDKMPRSDRLSYSPLCCPSFSRVPFGEHQSAVHFKPNLDLNNEQQRLPFLVLRNLNSNEIVLPFILNGAFGTGKSSVIAETVEAILRNVDQTSRVLICTRSYSAAKVYLDIFKKTLSKEILQKIKMIIPPERNPDSKFCIHNYSLKPDVFESNRVFITSLDNVADAMSLVVDEFHGCRSRFDYLFVDEAAQVLEIDAIMVYQFGKDESKFIFAGDVFQVRPVYYNLRLRNFAVPIVCRLDNMFFRCPAYEIYLKKVYRSHPRLVQYLSVAIYGKCELESSMTQPYCDLKPMTFSDSNIKGTNNEEFDEDFCSYRNTVEVDMVTSGIKNLIDKLQSTNLSVYTILVCSPFYSQVKLIRDRLNKEHLSVYVDMPSAIQGQEYDAVFISTVLTVNNENKHEIHHPTFNNNKNLINLAISRAKHYVEVIGDKQCLLNDLCKDQWITFIEFSAC